MGLLTLGLSEVYERHVPVFFSRYEHVFRVQRKVTFNQEIINTGDNEILQLWHVVAYGSEGTDEVYLVPLRRCMQYAHAVVRLGLYCDGRSRLAQPRWGELRN